jgi:hypothetical protein
MADSSPNGFVVLAVVFKSDNKALKPIEPTENTFVYIPTVTALNPMPRVPLVQQNLELSQRTIVR